MPSSFNPQLRPLSIGEVLDTGFSLYRARFGKLVAAVLIPLAPLAIVGAFVTAAIDPTFYDMSVPAADDYAVANLAGFLILAIGLVVGLAAALKVSADAYLGEETSAGAAVRVALRRLPPLLLAGLIVSIVFLVLLGLSAVLYLPILVVVWLGVKLSMLLPAMVIERRGPFTATNRSWVLLYDNFWRTFATLLVSSLLLGVLLVALTVGLEGGLFLADDTSPVVFATINTLGTLIVYALSYPLMAAMLTVQYFDLRVRKEGFDVQLLARGIGSEEPRFETTPERPPVTAEPETSTGGFVPPQSA